MDTFSPAPAAPTRTPWGPCLLALALVIVSGYATGIYHFVSAGALAPLRGHAQAPIVNAGEFRRIGAALLIYLAILPVLILAWRGRIFALIESNFWSGLALASTAAVFLFAVIHDWIFELDDKWAYYRTSRNVLSHGLPYWNPEDSLNINSSFLWPYVTSPGHLLGSWDWYVRIFGVASLVATAALFLRHLPGRTLALVGCAGVLLYFPAVLWGVGGMETTFATLYTMVAVILLHRRPESLLAWGLLGGVMFVRPDVVILGAIAYVPFFLFAQVSWRKKIAAGFAYAVPILGFVGMNKVVFGPPLPSSYYVKGLNKAFSGHYPFIVDVETGAMHFLGALSVSLPLFAALLIALGLIVRNGRLLRSPASWVIAGGLGHAAYFIACGYQHMGFTFRYWIPSLIPMFFAALWLIGQPAATPAATPAAAPPTRWQPFLLTLVIFAQAPFTLFQAHYAKIYDITLTRSNLRDNFSVQSYADWMHSWLKAGEYMKKKFTAQDKVFFFQNTAGVALTDAYVLDQYYMPLPTSSYPEIKEGLNHGPYDYRYFNYVITFADPHAGDELYLHEADPDFKGSQYDLNHTMMIYRRRSNWQEILRARH